MSEKNSAGDERKIICMKTGTERHPNSKGCVPLTATAGLLMYCEQAAGLSCGVKSVSCLLPLVNGTKWGHNFHFKLLQKIPFESRMAENGLKPGTALIRFLLGLWQYHK